MKNKGFTLAEVLITIGIIGILAAVLLPLINKYRPDTNMVMFIKTYDTIVTATNEIVSNEKLYPPQNTADANDIINYSQIPLANTSAQTIDGNTVSGNSKYCNLLALSIHTVGNISCSNQYNANPSNFTPSFKMANGVEVEVLTNRVVSESGGTYQSDIYIDVNGSGKGKDCFYSDSCTYPDRFKLTVSANGNIQVEDEKGKAYLARRADWKLRKDNIIIANGSQDHKPQNLPEQGPPQVGRCVWNSSLSADDAACKENSSDPTPDSDTTSSSDPTPDSKTTPDSNTPPSSDTSTQTYKGDNKNSYAGLNFTSMGYNLHPEYNLLQKTYYPGVYKDTQNNKYYVYQIDSDGKGYWGVITDASSYEQTLSSGGGAMISSLNNIVGKRDTLGYYYYVYDGAGASDIQDMDTSVTFSAYGTTYTAKDYYWGPEEKVKAFLGETYGIYD